ncbi:zf-HC2 domain-containing protein [Actinoplanes sp. NPDC049265]|uniref:zf-HC2 domain-containing protein n=1 Tax=Actinoplanes sp. NPDC049265 TaxID=3363902 RepID=UPI003712DBCA
MPDAAAQDDHVTDLLGPHYMDALTPAESDAVDRHLRDCAECRSAAESVVEVVAALGLLLEDDGAPSGAQKAAPSTPDVVRPGPVRAASVRPSGRTAPTGPARRTRSRRQRLALAKAGLALALVLVVGFGALTLLNRLTSDGGRAVVTVAATASAAAGGPSASVQASETGDGVHVKVAAAGLQLGTTYRLDAVTSDGTVHEVDQWSGAPTVQEVAGDLPVPFDQLAFVTISEVGGPPVLTVYLRGPGAATPR